MTGGWLKEGVEQEADEHDAEGDNAEEGRDQPGLENLPQNDRLGQRQCDDRHHEGQHGPERRPLAE